jgi:hypothetical protein
MRFTARRLARQHLRTTEGGLRASNTMKRGSSGRAGRHAAASSVAPICLHIGAPCVLASHSTITPSQRVVIVLEALKRRTKRLRDARDAVVHGDANHAALVAARKAPARLVRVGRSLVREGESGRVAAAVLAMMVRELRGPLSPLMVWLRKRAQRRLGGPPPNVLAQSLQPS